MCSTYLGFLQAALLENLLNGVFLGGRAELVLQGGLGCTIQRALSTLPVYHDCLSASYLAVMSKRTDGSAASLLAVGGEDGGHEPAAPLPLTPDVQARGIAVMLVRRSREGGGT